MSSESIPMPTSRPAVNARPTGALSFGAAAAGYAEFRPDYPDEAVAAAVGRPAGSVLDLAAGTGKLTARLVAARDTAESSTEILAVEPDAQMLATLRRLIPGARGMQGSAEQIPLPDGSVQVITVGQAFHWFDADIALPEMARVLAPGGRLALMWNVRDPDHEFTMAFEHEMDQHVRPPDGATGQSAPVSMPFSGRPEFTDPQLHTLPWRRPMTPIQLHGLLDTMSYVITADPARRRALHDAVDTLIDSWNSRLELAEICRVWVAHRR